MSNLHYFDCLRWYHETRSIRKNFGARKRGNFPRSRVPQRNTIQIKNLKRSCEALKKRNEILKKENANLKVQNHKKNKEINSRIQEIQDLEIKIASNLSDASTDDGEYTNFNLASSKSRNIFLIKPIF